MLHNFDTIKNVYWLYNMGKTKLICEKIIENNVFGTYLIGINSGVELIFANWPFSASNLKRQIRFLCIVLKKYVGKMETYTNTQIINKLIFSF